MLLSSGKRIPRLPTKLTNLTRFLRETRLVKLVNFVINNLIIEKLFKNDIL